ncbi:MAG TPA: AMP-binding protein [Xanthomonadales bacterium]|nr:AMP-binding protein [Xanthomonadales bacterium]
MSHTKLQAPPPLLPEVIALNAKWQGDRPAIVFGDRTLSWREFHDRACQVANGLDSIGIRKGDRVAVLMSNSADMVVVMFGIIIAGCATVPLNTLVTESSLAAMIRDAGARGVFASADHASRLDGHRGEMRSVVDGAWIVAGPGPSGWKDYAGWIESQSDQDPEVALADDDECNIIYSSGTTGQPKGIVHSHRRRLDWFYDLALALRYDRATVNLCSIGLFSNISWAGMGCTLLTGGTIIVMPAFEAGEWLRLVQEHQVTHSAMVPLQFRHILGEPDFEQFDVSSIKSLMCCGSPLAQELKLEIMDRLAPGLVELYGLTEGVITTLEPEQARARPASVGKPLMGTDLMILDKDDNPCAAGEAGEIVGRCRHLMVGYHDRPDANKEALWMDEQGRHWLRTGDIGRLDEAGYLYLVDRKKDLIISGGQNIYPADIESVLLDHPAVTETAVVGIDSEKWGESPLAIVVGDSNLIGARDLCAWTNQRVGKHQRLAGLEFVSELPRNANGKVLKRELRGLYRNWLTEGPEEVSRT